MDRADGGSCLPLQVPAAAKAPLYVLDLNVIFDVARQRPRAEASRRVMAAAFKTTCVWPFRRNLWRNSNATQ